MFNKRLQIFRQWMREVIVLVDWLKEKIKREITILVEKKYFQASDKKAAEIKKGNKIYHNVWIHKGAVLEAPVTIYANADIRNNTHIGAFTYINNGTTIFYGSRIGRYCSIGKKCEIGTVDHPTSWLSSSSIQYNAKGHFDIDAYCRDFPQRDFEQIEGCTIGNDVWIGSLTVIKSGVTIGDGAIVGANSVVTKDVPPYAIVGGVPAKLIRYRFDEPTIQKLLELKWWERDLCDLSGIAFDDIETAIKQLEALPHHRGQMEK
jgi:acetyltransferase-like isoleucine patch superfamily enzyme